MECTFYIAKCENLHTQVALYLEFENNCTKKCYITLTELQGGRNGLLMLPIWHLKGLLLTTSHFSYSASSAYNDGPLLILIEWLIFWLQVLNST